MTFCCGIHRHVAGVAAAVVLFGAPAGCGSAYRQGKPTTPGEALAARIEKAHGIRAWHAGECVAADIDLHFDPDIELRGEMLYDHHGGRVRMDLADGTTLVFDGERAWVSPASSQMPMARFHLLTWPYFLAVPFKLRDPGAQIADYGRLSIDGEAHAALRLTFEADIGDSPDDWYILYADPATDRLVAMSYIVTYGGTSVDEAEREPHAIVYQDFVTVDGVTLSTTWPFFLWSRQAGPYGDPIGRVKLSNLRFVSLDERDFSRPSDARGDPHPVPPVARRLGDFLRGGLDPQQLTITYSDLHGLWGGLQLTVYGTGRVEQEAAQVEPPPQVPHGLGPDEVRKLVALLVEERAWEQQVPDRRPQPDESRATLRIDAGNATSLIWEWHHDLEANDRIGRILAKMKALAWVTSATDD